MKKFISKSFFFLAPILFLLLLTELFYHTDKGDLIRFGYVFDTGTYHDKIKMANPKIPIRYHSFNQINTETQNNFTVLTIGDSFSEQRNFGYKNYLANYDSISVLHINRRLSKNQIQTLMNLSNGDFFENIHVKYVVLQVVERGVNKLADNIITDHKVDLNEFVSSIKNELPKINSKKNKYQLFSDRIFKIPYVNLLYLFKDKPNYSNTYKVNTNKKFFTDKGNTLLFVNEDIENLSYNNDKTKIESLNKTLNLLHKKLAAKGVQLIFMPAPDKYSIYYSEITKKDIYPKPIFFEYFNELPKNYIYVNSYAINSKLIETKKDVYYYDDTHWTPATSQFLAKELIEVIRNNK